MKRFPVLRLLAALAVVLPSAVLARDPPPVAPPGPDETLIYVIREGHLLGAAVGHWLAVNDKTVARLRNDKHAVIRHPAGLLTLNIANSGIPVAAAALDNRGGETVYLQWQLGDTEFIELDEKTALKMLRKTKRMDPVEEDLPNNEQFPVLMNLSRMGFDLMRSAAQPPGPDADNAVITVFRQKEGNKLEFGIWYDKGFVGTLAAEQALSVAVPPGTYFFMAGNTGVTQMKAEVEAGKHYYAWLDYGKMMGRVRLTPVAASEAADLDKWLRKVDYVELDESALSDGVRARERIVVDYLRDVAAKAGSGEVDFNLLGAEHAF